MTVMLGGVGVTGVFPIFAREQLIAQHAHVAQGHAQPLSPGRITGRRCVSNQDHSVAIRVLHPRLGAVEGSQRPGRPCAFVEVRIHSDLLAAFKVAWKILRAVVTGMSIVTTEIGTGAPLALRKDHGLLAGFGVDDQVRDILRRAHVVHQNARNQVPVGVPAKFEARGGTHVGRTAIRRDHQPCVHFLGAAIFSEHHGSGRSRPHIAHSHPPTHLRSRLCGRPQQQLLHGRMVKRQTWELMRGRRYHITMHDQCGARIKIGPADLVGNASNEQIVDAEMARLGHTPGCDELPPNPVLELPVALQHQHMCAVGCHGTGECRAA